MGLSWEKESWHPEFLLSSFWSLGPLFHLGGGVSELLPHHRCGFHGIRRREVEIYTTLGFSQVQDKPLTIIYPDSVSPNLLAYLLVKLRIHRKLAQPKHFPKPDGQGIPRSTETLPWQILRAIFHTSPHFPLYLPLLPVLSCQTLKDWSL